MGTLTGGTARFNLAGTETVGIGATTKQMTLASPAGQYALSLSNGTGGASTGNTVASLLGTLTSGTPVDINLRTLTLAGVDSPITFTNISAALVQEKTSGGSNFLLVGDSSGTLTNAITAFWNTATSQEKVPAGGAVGFAGPAGYTVDATHCILRLNANTGTVVYQVDLIGAQ